MAKASVYPLCRVLKEPEEYDGIYSRRFYPGLYLTRDRRFLVQDDSWDLGGPQWEVHAVHVDQNGDFYAADECDDPQLTADNELLISTGLGAPFGERGTIFPTRRKAIEALQKVAYE